MWSLPRYGDSCDWKLFCVPVDKSEPMQLNTRNKWRAYCCCFNFQLSSQGPTEGAAQSPTRPKEGITTSPTPSSSPRPLPSVPPWMYVFRHPSDFSTLHKTCSPKNFQKLVHVFFQPALLAFKKASCFSQPHPPHAQVQDV